jgi:class III cytochrome C family protein
MKFKQMVSVLLGVTFMLTGLYAIAYQQADTREGRADIIVIDSMKVFGDLERPGVPFPHDQHTDALEKQGQDCSTCHQKIDDKLVLKFKRTADTDHETTLDIYHTDCITCHEENAVADQDTGPVECGTCHQLEPTVVAAQAVIDFDASLHHKHIEAAENTCESCHHGYDATKEEIVYEKGQEDSCRTCHKDQFVDNAMSYKDASHEQCIDCHQQKKAEDKIENAAVASVKCAGCHEADQLKKIAKLDTIPRLDRNQPDTTFVKSFDKITSQMMDAVIFDHQKHETNVSECSTCHHETLNACESCHTLSGKKEGDWVTLAQAMHDVKSDRSCTGCHEEKVQAKECSGCHSLIQTKMHVSEGQSCQTCHAVSIEGLGKDKASGAELMAKHYQPKPPQETTIDIDALPEKIIIDVISKEYQGVSFPHRDIVQTMMNNIEGNALADNFHQGKNVVCQSCHHNSPDTLDPPPKCISCHSSSETAMGSEVPEMKAAYHQQCFDCHKALEINEPETTDCVSCHEEKE